MPCTTRYASTTSDTCSIAHRTASLLHPHFSYQCRYAPACQMVVARATVLPSSPTTLDRLATDVRVGPPAGLRPPGCESKGRIEEPSRGDSHEGFQGCAICSYVRVATQQSRIESDWCNALPPPHLFVAAAALSPPLRPARRRQGLLSHP